MRFAIACWTIFSTTTVDVVDDRLADFGASCTTEDDGACDVVFKVLGPIDQAQLRATAGSGSVELALGILPAVAQRWSGSMWRATSPGSRAMALQ